MTSIKSFKSFQESIAKCSRFTRIIVSVVASLILAIALGGVWWYEIVDFKVTFVCNNLELGMSYYLAQN